MLKRLSRFLLGTLRGRLIVSVAAVHAVLMALFVADLTARQSAMLLERQIDDATALSQLLATSAAGWIVANDVSGLQELVETQRRYPEVLFVNLADKEGRVLADTDTSRLGLYLRDLPGEPRPTVLARTPALVDVAVPAMLGEHQVGWARVGIGQKAAGEKLAAITRDGVIYALGAILIGSLVAWFVGRGITRRLHAVQETIDAVRAGNRLARSPLAGDDEAAVMAREFNAMLDDLAERDTELRVSEEKYRSLIMKVQTAIVVHDARGRILTCNPLAQALLGLSEAQLLGKALIDPEWHFLRQDGSAGPIDEYPASKVLSTRRPLRGEVMGISHPDRKDATWVLVNAEPDFDASGDITQIVVSFVDITELRLIQRQLEMLNLAVNTSNDAIFLHDDTLRFVYVNETACRSLGYSREELLTMAPPDIDPDVTREIALEMKRTMLLDHSLHKFETRHRASDGRVFPVELSGSMFEYGGNVFGLSVVRDITERKEAEQRLRASEQAFRALVENSPDVIVRYDREGRRIYVNPEFERVNQLTARQVKGKKPTEISAGLKPMAAEFTERLMAAMAAGAVDKIDLSWTVDGKPKCWYVRVVPEFDANGQVVSALTIWSDISERKQAEEEIRKLNESLEQRVADRTAQLEASNKELEAFAYSVSHDLRAPLRHIDGYVDLLVARCRDGLDDKGLHYVDTIAASARRMGILIDDLLQFSRTGRAEMHRKLVDMNRALEDVLVPLKETHAGRHIEWVIGTLPSVRGDYALLRQVWANLLENAVKFTRSREDARIEVGGHVESGETVFVVADNGVGFDMRYVGKLFGVFQRLHSQEEFEGTGIGLASVQRIIARHGGRVWAAAELGRGATFYFSLPNERRSD